jgi:hypothetical protein
MELVEILERAVSASDKTYHTEKPQAFQAISRSMLSHKIQQRNEMLSTELAETERVMAASGKTLYAN